VRSTVPGMGVQVSAIGLGGFDLGKPNPAEATQIVHEAMDAGIDFMDNAWETTMAQRDGWVQRCRGGGLSFLMTRSAPTAAIAKWRCGSWAIAAAAESKLFRPVARIQ